MAIKSFRPKTHSLRFKTVLDYKQELTTDEPHKPLLEAKNRIDGRNNYGQIDGPASRRRQQEALSHHRFQARQGRHSRQGRDDRVRSEPLRLHRPAELCRRRAPLHSAADRVEGRHVGGFRSGGRYSCGQRAAAEEYSARHDGAQHRAASRQGRADGAQRRARQRNWLRRKAAMLT